MKKLLLTTLLLLAVTMAGMAQKMKTVTVTNADEFIKAIASNTNINIKGNDIIDLIPALNKLDDSHDYIKHRDDKSIAPGAYFLGDELVIVNINNLTINGESAETTHIQSASSYTNVLRFENCSNITIKNIKAGHTIIGDCSADVISLHNCKKVTIEKCDLYGCGFNGIWMDECNDVTVNNTEIRDCSGSMVSMWNNNNVVFNECYMHNCLSGIHDHKNTNVQYNNCNIVEGDYEEHAYFDDKGNYDEYYDEDFEGGYEGYYDTVVSDDLYNSLADAQDMFLDSLGTEFVNGVIYADLGEDAGHLVIPETKGIYTIYIPKYQSDKGTYTFKYVQKVDTNDGDKLAIGDNHLLIGKVSDKLITMLSIEFSQNEPISITMIIVDSSEDNKIIMAVHGKTPDTLEECSRDVIDKHFDLQIKTIEELRECCEVYPWG